MHWTVLKVICYDTVKTHKQCFCTRAVPHLHHSWEGHLLALRESLCGCSRVYVLEISNDERISFQVWASGASAECSTLFTIQLHARTPHPLCTHIQMRESVFTKKAIHMQGHLQILSSMPAAWAVWPKFPH